ncbi:MAG: rubrerythrin-like domain-containing protein [Haloferacaceae archaeon]
MTEHPPFVCRDCAGRVGPEAYRAVCPDCGGDLRRLAVR